MQKVFGLTQIRVNPYYSDYANEFVNLSTEHFTKVSYTFNFVEQNNNYILLYNWLPKIGTGFQIKWLQIQEGTESTDYDIEKSSIVQTNKNHTLMAQWKWNGSYGSSIPSLYSNLYVGTNSSGALVEKTHSSDAYYNGNYDCPRSLYTIFSNNAQTVKSKQSLVSGTNSFTGLNLTNSWIYLGVHCGGHTTGISVGDLKLTFIGTSYNLQTSVSNGFIEPLVVCSSSSWSDAYIFNSVNNLITGRNNNSC